jgi:hypothetical protein
MKWTPVFSRACWITCKVARRLRERALSLPAKKREKYRMLIRLHLLLAEPKSDLATIDYGKHVYHRRP